MYSVLKLTITNSILKNNKVYFDKTNKNHEKFSNYSLTQGGAIYFEPENVKLEKTVIFELLDSEISDS